MRKVISAEHQVLNKIMITNTLNDDRDHPLTRAY